MPNPDSPVSVELLRIQLARLQTENVALKGGGGSGTSDGMEARVAKLEADAAHTLETLRDMKGDIKELRGDLKTDFRILFSAIIAVALGLAGLMAKGFGWL